MRNLKKFLALVLAMMMAFSLMVTANAATTSEDLNFSDSEQVADAFLEDIQVLTGMEVIKGYTDGTFKPDTTINRHQMATFIYRMTTGDTSDLKDLYLSQIAAEKFPDVNAEDSYAGYIGYCYVNGYIAGFPDGTFKPMNKVTGYQALVMILRAMGYNNPADNFTGADWQSLAASRARMNNLLVNIDKTVYSNTFSQPAPRQLVAEMVFQGLIQPQVTYTTAFSYQKYGMVGGVLSNVLNPSLGYEFFGLTNHKGIVVGNQYTGEKNTKIGFSMDVDVNKGLNIGDNNDSWSLGTAGWTLTGNLASATINDDVEKAAYYYNSGLVHNNAGVAVGDYNITLSFQWESNLKLFNHAVDVWYDYRGAANETIKLTGDNVSGSVTYKTDLKTYAVFDRVVDTAVVVAPDGALTGGTAYNGTIENVGEAINETTDMRVPDNLFFNYAFAAMDSGNWGNDTSAQSADSPIKANNDLIGNNGHDMAEAANWPLYLVISNSADKTADVVITLDLTMSQVVQDNNTQDPFSTGVTNYNGSGTAYFDTYGIPTGATTQTYTNIADANRVDDYNAMLKDYVAAVTVTGTTGPNCTNGSNSPTISKNGVTPAAAAACAKAYNVNLTGSGNSTYYYELDQLTSKVTANLVKYDKDDQTVYLDNGQTYERSIFALATDGTFKAHTQVMAPTQSGAYTFYLDEEGNWLFWEQAAKESTFVYGTYIDWQTQLASSTFSYPLVYTNAAGEERLQTNIVSIDGTSMSVTEYAKVMLPKRDTITGSNSGFVPGQYIGYALDGDKLTTVGTTPNATGFVQAGTGDNDFGEGGANSSTVTTITATSVAIGAHPVTDATSATTGTGLFLTERTKFIIVDGAGNANQSVTVYEGLAEFLGTHKSVTIDATTAPIPSNRLGNYLSDGTNTVVPDDYAGKDAPWQMIYYSVEEDPYSQNYDQMDRHIDTVFIPKALLKTTDDVSGNLYFVGDSTYGLIDAPSKATQFTFYQNGVKSILWIDGLVNDLVNTDEDADIVKAFGDNVFYQLRNTGSKAVDGEPIFALVPFDSQDAANKAIIGQYYGYNTTYPDDATHSNLSTIRGAVSQTTVDATGSGKGYLATTRNSQVAYIGGRVAADLFNVASTSVLNLNDDFTINSLGDLNDQSALTNNQGVDVSCILGTGVKNISFIYVNY